MQRIGTLDPVVLAAHGPGRDQEPFLVGRQEVGGPASLRAGTGSRERRHRRPGPTAVPGAPHGCRSNATDRRVIPRRAPASCVALVVARFFLVSSRRSTDERVGLVAFRGRATCSAEAITLMKRSTAASRFCRWLRRSSLTSRIRPVRSSRRASRASSSARCASVQARAFRHVPAQLDAGGGAVHVLAACAARRSGVEGQFPPRNAERGGDFDTAVGTGHALQTNSLPGADAIVSVGGGRRYNSIHVRFGASRHASRRPGACPARLLRRRGFSPAGRGRGPHPRSGAVPRRHRRERVVATRGQQGGRRSWRTVSPCLSSRSRRTNWKIPVTPPIRSTAATSARSELWALLQNLRTQHSYDVDHRRQSRR